MGVYFPGEAILVHINIDLCRQYLRTRFPIVIFYSPDQPIAPPSTPFASIVESPVRAITPRDVSYFSMRASDSKHNFIGRHRNNFSTIRSLKGHNHPYMLLRQRLKKEHRWKGQQSQAVMTVYNDTGILQTNDYDTDNLSIGVVCVKNAEKGAGRARQSGCTTQEDIQQVVYTPQRARYINREDDKSKCHI